MRISDWSSDVCSSDLLDARRQCFRNLIELGRGLRGDNPAVLADQHQHRADDRFLAVHTTRTRSQIATNANVGDLADRDWGSPASRRDSIADLIDRAHAGIDPKSAV